MDVVWLSRLQFALTIMFHYLFPPLTIGMGVVLVYLEANYLRTREPIYETAARFWTQLYAATFAMGVATGIVMEFQFGTNWANYSRFVGDVFGSALAAEGIFAFFLESGFLAVLVFGWEKVGPRFHLFATVMVALGSIFSSIWIIVANSWQQTPAGHRIATMMRDGQPWLIDGQPVMRAETADFWAVVWNPSTIHRLSHTLFGAFILGAFFIMSISAWYLLQRTHEDFARRSFTGGLIFATFFSTIMWISGDLNARMVGREQPAKLAAFEGHFETGRGDLTLLGLPLEKEGRMAFNIAVPGLLSLLVHHDSSKPVLGLDKVPREYWPPVLPAFTAFHMMVGVGVFCFATTALASYLRWRGTLFQTRWLLWVFVFAVIAPFVGNEAGWAAAEIGRQPWIVHPRVVRDAAGEPLLNAAGMLQYRLDEGLLTRHGVSETVQADHVLISIILFSLIYALLFLVWVSVLHHKIQVGPKPVKLGSESIGQGWTESSAARTLHQSTMSEAKQDPRPGEV